MTVPRAPIRGIGHEILDFCGRELVPLGGVGAIIHECSFLKKEAPTTELLPCPECGTLKVGRSIENVELSDGVKVSKLPHLKCMACGFRSFDDQAMKEIHHARTSLRDCKEISWTLWGLSVPQIWLRRLSESAGVAVSTSRNSRLRSSQRWGAIGHPKVQVIFLQSLSGLAHSG